MAVIDDVPGLRVEITAHDEFPLLEFDDPDEGAAKQNTVTKYIQSIPGELFTVRWRFNDPFPRDLAVRARVSLDGTHMANTVVHRGNLYKGFFCSWMALSFDRDGNTCFSSFRFPPLNKDGELDPVLFDEEEERCITVEFQYATELRQIWITPDNSFDAPVLPQYSPQQSFIDNVAHHDCLAPAETFGPHGFRTRVGNYISPPFATFNFKYRSPVCGERTTEHRALKQTVRDTENTLDITATARLYSEILAQGDVTQ